MFANTLTLTIDTVARTLLRTNQDNYGSEYSYSDDVEVITMKIRHSVDKQGGFNVKRHNMTLERTVFATASKAEQYYTATVTLRDRVGSGPANLLKTWVGFNTLVLALDDTFVAGDN